jgi:hypothetical protein
MQFANLAGTSIFGTGSEWFWAMAQFIVVVISLFGIYRQLRSQGAANALARIQTLDRRYHSREVNAAKLSLAIQLRQGKPINDMWIRIDTVADFFETLYELYKAGFMPLDEIDERFGAGSQIWWRLLRPTLEEARLAESEPRLARNFELLSELCDRLSRDRGSPRTWITEGPVEVLLDQMIARMTDALTLANEVDQHEIPRLPKGPLPTLAHPG